MNTPPKFYTIHQLQLKGDSLEIGYFAIDAGQNGQIKRMEFKYSETYLATGKAHRISPNLPPANTQETLTFNSDGRSFVGFVDDLLPDDWGKKIIARKLNQRFVTNLDALDFIGDGASIGANKITPFGSKPSWSLGVEVRKAEKTLTALFEGDIEQLSEEELATAMLVKGGSNTGGARPKMLIIDGRDKPCLIKPNQRKDAFDSAALEHASMEMCRRAGIPTANTYLYDLHGDIRSLVIERFDVTPDGGRYPVLTINSLIKDPITCCDALHFSYQDIADCIKRYSYQPREDLNQLFGQLLINQALMNTDDHARNFSLLKDEKGWRLSPVYDVIPQQMFRAEHECTLNGNGYLPFLCEYQSTAKTLGLMPKDGKKVHDNVVDALAGWRDLLLELGIHDPQLLAIPETSNPR